MNFYPRPPRGGRRAAFQQLIGIESISIHALREEGDGFTGCPTRRGQISIHALREEGDAALHVPAGGSNVFLSTPSARRATASSTSLTAVHGFLSTPSARRATQKKNGFQLALKNFYPRPPRGGRPDIFSNLNG